MLVHKFRLYTQASYKDEGSWLGCNTNYIKEKDSMQKKTQMTILIKHS